MYYPELTQSLTELAFCRSHAPARACRVKSLNHQPPTHEPIEILVHSLLLLLLRGRRRRRSRRKVEMKRNASTIPRRKKFNERKSVRYSIRMIHDGKSTRPHAMPGRKRKRKMGDYDLNHHPSAINNSTPLHFTPPFWSCTEAAASAVAENRSDPMWLWLVVVNFIVSTAHSRATEPQSR